MIDARAAHSAPVDESVAYAASVTSPEHLARACSRRPWLVGVASVVVSLLFLLALPQRFAVNENVDYREHYEPIARNLLAGRGVVDKNGGLELRYPPGYPLLLAGAFWLAKWVAVPEPAIVTIADVLGMGVAAFFVFLIARRLWGAEPALVSSLAWTTYPLALYLLKQPNSEIPFVVALLGAAYCLISVVQRSDGGLWQCGACGALVGVAMLIRPIAIGLGVVCAVLVMLGRPRHRMLSALALLAGNFLAVAPWEAWVYQRTESVIALSAAGPAAIRDGLTFAVRSKGFREGTWVPAQVREVMQHVSDQYPRLVSVGAVGEVLAREFREHPSAVVQLAVIKAARSWYGTDSQRFEGLILGVQGVYLAIVGLATARAWRSGGVARRAVVGAWMITGYFWGMNVVSSSLARYMVPTMSLLFVPVAALFCRRCEQENSELQRAR